MVHVLKVLVRVHVNVLKVLAVLSQFCVASRISQQRHAPLPRTTIPPQHPLQCSNSKPSGRTGTHDHPLTHHLPFDHAPDAPLSTNFSLCDTRTLLTPSHLLEQTAQHKQQPTAVPNKATFSNSIIWAVRTESCPLIRKANCTLRALVP